MNIEIIKCFLASPSDTQEERKICELVIANLNRDLGDVHKFRLELLKWEFDTYPSFKGEYSQDIISKQMGDEYQLFIGIMHQKFGSPTKGAESGTVEEFNNAYNMIRMNKNVDIMFYFNTEIIGSSNSLDFVSLQNIQDFKAHLRELGGLYFEYTGSKEFEGNLRTHLIKYLNDRFNKDNESRKLDLTKKEFLYNHFKDRLNTALCTFTSQPVIWVEPILSTTNEISANPDVNYSQRVPVDSLISDPKSTIIKSPPQFGLTSLAHYLVKSAWENNHFWIYLNGDDYKPHNIHNAVSNEAKKLGMEIHDVDCVILDNWYGNSSNSYKLLKSLSDAHPNTPIYLMYTLDDAKFLDDDNDVEIDREFEVLHLLALPRHQLRKMVAEYNKVRLIGDEDAVLSKVIFDLEVLNIHRTPFNCLTLLKVSENHFENSPVNRTAMLEMILIVLFVTDEIPKYKSKPDLKDCEYILGRFCEGMIRNDFYEFSRASFIDELKAFCEVNYIELEVDLVFDVLFKNSIIISKGLNYVFKSSYWVFYFAAKRMHNNPEFRDFIFESKKYTAFPEIIEFYTGIDRNRDDAINILKKDIAQTCDTVIQKVGITESINPLALMHWHPTEAQVMKAQNEISDSVINSSLPEAIKDQHADKSYDQIRPYNQSIQAFFEEYSVMNLMRNITASSRALRNSDYVDPVLKKALLKEILRAWEQMSIVLFALAPVLASKGEAQIEGASFQLSGDFGNTVEEKINRIIQVNPTNVVGYFRNDISSDKIGPLLFEQFKEEQNALKRHQLALLIIFSRPKHWFKNIENYVVSLPKNSFYLFDTVNAIKAKIKFDFLSDVEFRELQILYKMGLAKHQFGDKRPTHRDMNRIPNHLLPKRENGDAP